MHEAPSIKLNMAMNVLLTASSILFPLITLPYVTRILGAEGVGRVYTASSLITFLSMFAELGIPVYGVRACARVRGDRAELSRTASEIMTLSLAASAVTYALMALMLMIPAFRQDRGMIAVMSLVIILNAIGAEWLYKSVEQFTYITVRSVIFKAAALAGMFLLVRKPDDYMIYGVLTVFAASASDVVNCIRARRYADIRITSLKDSKRHIRAAFMFFALAVATTVYTSLDLTILSLMKGSAEAGLYGVAVRIKLVIVSLVTSVSAVLLPRNSYYLSEGLRDRFRLLVSRTMDAVILTSLPAAVFFMIFAPDCIMLLAGDGFAGAIRPMRIIMPAVVAIGISNIIGVQMLIPAGREKQTVTAAVIGAGVDLILNLFLIPSHASSGAAAATLAAEICVTGYMMFEAKRLPELRVRSGVRPGRLAAALVTACLAVCVLFAGIAGAKGLPAAGALHAYIASGAGSVMSMTGVDAGSAQGLFLQEMTDPGPTLVRLIIAAACFFGSYIAAAWLMRVIPKRDRNDDSRHEA